MWGIIACNRGMWGCETWCHHGDEIDLYATKEEAQKAVEERRERSGRVNNFTEYFVAEYKEYSWQERGF